MNLLKKIALISNLMIIVPAISLEIENNSKLMDYSNQELNNKKYTHLDLSNYKFTKSRLIECDFFRSKLQKTNFSGADIKNTNFNLSDLRGAILNDTYFIGHECTGISMVGALMNDQTSFENAFYIENDTKIQITRDFLFEQGVQFVD